MGGIETIENENRVRAVAVGNAPLLATMARTASVSNSLAELVVFWSSGEQQWNAATAGAANNAALDARSCRY